MRILFVLLYFLAGISKLNEGWVVGTYFSTLQGGLPLVPDSLTPLLTNFVIILEIGLSWFLLSKRTKVRELVFVIFLVFHVYSSLLVRIYYPSLCIPLLFFLFYKLPKEFNFSWKLKMRSVTPYILLVLLLFQLYPVIFKKNVLFTGEGVRLSMTMFDANRQSEVTVVRSFIGEEETTQVDSQSASSLRASPYVYWFNLNRECKQNKTISKISLVMDISVNGSGFKRLVDVDDICAKEYSFFSTNNWIFDPNEAEIVGYPGKNTFLSPLNFNKSTHLYKEEQFGFADSFLANLLYSNYVYLKYLYVVFALFMFFIPKKHI